MSSATAAAAVSRGRAELTARPWLRAESAGIDPPGVLSWCPLDDGDGQSHPTGAGLLHRRPCLPPWGAAVIVASAGRRAEVQPGRAVGNVSDTHTSPTPIDRPALVRSISEVALIASVEEGPPAPGRQSVPVTQLDLYGRRSARRLPCARRPPNAEATRWNVGWAMRMSRSDAAAIRVVTRHGSSAASCQTL